jgi:hypothetical protein
VLPGARQADPYPRVPRVLTPEGDSRGLYIRKRSASGFEVREQQGGRSSLTFSYRVVARRFDL